MDQNKNECTLDSLESRIYKNKYRLSNESKVNDK